MTIRPHDLAALYQVVTRAYFISRSMPVETVYPQHEHKSCFEDDEDDLLRLVEEFHNAWRTIRRSRRNRTMEPTVREPWEKLEWTREPTED